MDSNKFLSNINALIQNTLMSHLGIVFTKVGNNFIEATMPVNNNVMNPFKIVHGGAYMALAESVGSALSVMLTDTAKFEVRGLEINGNHVKSVLQGVITARATILHKGKSTHVCEIKITDSNNNLVNISRMTNIIVAKSN